MNTLAKLVIALVALDADDSLPLAALASSRELLWAHQPSRRTPMNATKFPTSAKTLTSRKIIYFRGLGGGQFGTLDVVALSPRSVQLALGGDFVTLTIEQWAKIRKAVDVFFFAAHGQPAPPQYSTEPIHEDEGDEEVTITPPPPPEPAVAPSRRRRTGAARAR